MANASFRGSKNITRELKNSINQKVSNVAQKTKEVASTIREKAQNVTGKINNAVKAANDKVPSPVVDKYMSLKNAANQFADSNTAISKFVFIVVVIYFCYQIFLILNFWDKIKFCDDIM